MKKNIILIGIIISTMLIGIVAAVSAQLPVAPVVERDAISQFFVDFGHNFGLFTVAGRDRQCGKTGPATTNGYYCESTSPNGCPNYVEKAISPTGGNVYFSSSYLLSKASCTNALIDTYNANWGYGGEVDTNAFVGSYVANNGYVEVYCCPYKACTSNSDCVTNGYGTTCTTSTGACSGTAPTWHTHTFTCNSQTGTWTSDGTVNYGNSRFCSWGSDYNNYKVSGGEATGTCYTSAPEGWCTAPPTSYCDANGNWLNRAGKCSSDGTTAYFCYSDTVVGINAASYTGNDYESSYYCPNYGTKTEGGVTLCSNNKCVVTPTQGQTCSQLGGTICSSDKSCQRNDKIGTGESWPAWITATDTERCCGTSGTCTSYDEVWICGDGTCNGDETCSSCSQDCGPCTTDKTCSENGGVCRLKLTGCTEITGTCGAVDKCCNEGGVNGTLKLLGESCSQDTECITKSCDKNGWWIFGSYKCAPTPWSKSIKLAVTREQLSTMTTAEKLSFVCLTSDQCIAPNNATASCVSVKNLQDEGTLQDSAGFLAETKTTIDSTVRGATGFAIGGAMACGFGFLMVGGICVASSGAGCIALPTVVGACAAVTQGAALIGAGAGYLDSQAQIGLSNEDPLVKAVEAKDASSVGICIAENSASYCKYTEWAGFFKIPGMDKCTSGLIIIIGGLVVLVLLFRK